MKKKYEGLEMKLLVISQDIVTSSVYVQWGADWDGNAGQDDGWTDGNIFA